MGIVYNGVNFHGDGPDVEYDQMKLGAQLIKGIPGLTCEIGVRRGLGSVTIMSACQNNNDQRIHIGVDPWGDIEYHDVTGELRLDYTNAMKRETLRDLYNWCSITQQEFLLFNMKDIEFFERFSTGVPIHDFHSSLINEYAYVYCDGPHDVESVQTEASFFEARMPVGAVIQFDNTDHYDHSHVHQWLLDHGFTCITEGFGGGGEFDKQSYQRENR